MLTLVQEAEFEDVWGIEELIHKAEEMLRNPLYTDSNLFEGVNLVARKQQITDLKIQYALSKKDTLTAAQMAMKLLVEDEYVIDTVLMNCVTTLNTHFNLHGDPNQVPNLAQGVKRETRRGQVDSLREAKNVIFCLDYSGSMAGERMDRYVKYFFPFFSSRKQRSYRGISYAFLGFFSITEQGRICSGCMKSIAWTKTTLVLFVSTMQLMKI